MIENNEAGFQAKDGACILSQNATASEYTALLSNFDPCRALSWSCVSVRFLQCCPCHGCACQQRVVDKGTSARKVCCIVLIALFTACAVCVCVGSGIGFKSVFTLSSTPQIHSGIFHFQYSDSDPDLKCVFAHSATVFLLMD